VVTRLRDARDARLVFDPARDHTTHIVSDFRGIASERIEI
jgi:hypothetical protein